MKLRDGLPSLRSRSPQRILEASFAVACTKSGFQIAHYSIQSNHVHLICEAEDAFSISRAVQGLAIRIAKRLNKLWGRRGSVFADRYHRQDLGNPRQVWNGLRYVLLNVIRHAGRRRSSRTPRPDPFSSGSWFPGWAETFAVRDPAHAVAPPVAAPRTWLLTRGWKRHGLISLADRPAAP